VIESAMEEVTDGLRRSEMRELMGRSESELVQSKSDRRILRGMFLLASSWRSMPCQL